MAINNELNKSIRTYLEKEYIQPEFMERDRELEKYLILKSKLELKLLSNLHAGVRDEWNGLPLPESRAYLNFPSDEYIKNDKLVIFTQKGKLNYKRMRSEVRSYKGFSYDLGDIIFSIDGTLNLNFMSLSDKESEKKLARYIRCKKIARGTYKLSGVGVPEFGYPVISPVFEQGGRVEDRSKHHDSFYSLISRKSPLSIINTPVIYSLALFYNFEHEEEAVRYLQDWYRVEDKVFSRAGWLDGRKGWDIHRRVDALWDYYQKMKNELIFKFCTEVGHPYLLFEKNLENNTLLPITAWTKAGVDKRFFFNIPPVQDNILASLDEIKDKPEATLILTDSIEVVGEINAKVPDSQDIIWTTWYEGKEAVSTISWDCLRKRNVFYLITEQPDINNKDAYDTAYAVYEKVKDIYGINLHFIEHIKLSNGANSFNIMSCEEFEAKALQVLHKEDMLYSAEFQPLSMKQLIDKPLPERDFLLAPIILERSTTLIYAQTNIGKTWFALCMAYIISVKGCMFDFWKANRARKILYIDSEMDEFSLRNRVKIIAKMKFDDRRYGNGYSNKNFFCLSKKRSKIDNESFEKKVTQFVKEKKISLIVLDNLTAFTQHNDSAKSWEDIHAWLDDLKQMNCAVIIIHHTNKSGQQRGTSATTNAVDNVIRLSNPDNKNENSKNSSEFKEEDNEDNKEDNLPLESSEGMKMIVDVEKGRDIHGEGRKKLEIEICPDASVPYCKLIHKNGMQALSRSSYNTNKKHKRVSSLDEAEVLDALAHVTSIKELAGKVGCAVSRIYQISGLEEHKNYKLMISKANDEAEKQKQKIKELYKDGKSEKEIASLVGCSISTVNRKLIDLYLKQVKKHYPSKVTIPSIAERLAIDEKLVKKIVNEIEIQKLKKLFAQDVTIEQIISKVKLPEKRIKKKLAALEKERSEKADRLHKLKEIEILFAKGRSLVEILKLSDLPERTAKVEYNRCSKKQARR